jgi:hypothetical protein
MPILIKLMELKYLILLKFRIFLNIIINYQGKLLRTISIIIIRFKH